ncbi:hypothetical protein FO519_005887 [Halicephalobus sp. NKZ332]|nr:hypothetical protein FO519_005887 [Halicephalobus sp. NKZ332]
MVQKSIAEYCDAHSDASCLPNFFVSLPSCTTDQDCHSLQIEDQIRPYCENRKCRVSLICPLGFFSWNGGCLPYSTNNQKCPAGSEQCIQGLLCVDGFCMGACSEGEILVNGVCTVHGNLDTPKTLMPPTTASTPTTLSTPRCIERDCISEGCPSRYPVCTHKESSNSYHCCKRSRRTGRPNRHIDSYFPQEKGENSLEFRQGSSAMETVQYNVPKSRRRKIIPVPQIIQPNFPQRAISVISTATSAPLISYIARNIYSGCIPFAEVQVGNFCYPKVQVGSACIYSAQCPSRTSVNGQPPYLCINNICQLSVVCSPGYFLLNNTCLKYSASGQTCSSTVNQCLAGSTCINGECYSGCGYNQLLIENVCVGYADYGCILRSCESDGCPSQYSTCTFLRTQNAYVCCNQQVETALLCPNTGVRPQLSFGSNIPIDCVAKQCARGYTCTHVIVSGSSSPPRTCTFDDIQLTNGTLPGETVMVPNGIQTVNGCYQINAVCDATSFPGATVFMEFNGGIAGPTTGDTAVVQANLVCANGAWTFSQGGVTDVITDIACYSNATTVDPTCNGCTEDSIAVSIGTLPGETPTFPGGIQVVNGCQQLTVQCSTNVAGDAVFMQFNNGLGGPDQNFLPTVSALLTCVNGGWQYTSEAITTIVTQVDCIEGLGAR